MKEFKTLKIIGVDHGYGNIKTAGTVTKNGVTAYETEPIFSGNILEYGGLYYRFNKKEYHIRLAGCSLYPQGYPAVVSRLKDFRGTNLLADIGNGTMNILYINNKKAVESRCWTEKFGVSQCMTAARNTVMDTFGFRIDEATIEQVFRHGTADIGKPYLDCITSAARQYVADIFATLRRYEYNPDLMRLYIVGGGGCLIRNFGRYEENRVTIIDDICATAKGYEALALAALRRKERP